MITILNTMREQSRRIRQPTREEALGCEASRWQRRSQSQVRVNATGFARYSDMSDDGWRRSVDGHRNQGGTARLPLVPVGMRGYFMSFRRSRRDS